VKWFLDPLNKTVQKLVLNWRNRSCKCYATETCTSALYRGQITLAFCAFRNREVVVR